MHGLLIEKLVDESMQVQKITVPSIVCFVPYFVCRHNLTVGVFEMIWWKKGGWEEGRTVVRRLYMFELSHIFVELNVNDESWGFSIDLFKIVPHERFWMHNVDGYVVYLLDYTSFDFIYSILSPNNWKAGVSLTRVFHA